MSADPTTTTRRVGTLKRMPNAQRHSITREQIVDAIETLRSDLREYRDATDRDVETMAERLAQIEAEMNRIYWYILCPCLICAVVLGSMAVRSIIDRFMGG